MAKGIVLTAGLAMLTGCGSGGEQTYSVLSTGQSFKQASAGNGQIDILWVVDNSGSMDPLQTNLNTNFNSFMSDFMHKGYDFHLAVTSSDSYRGGATFKNNPALARFSDGVMQHSNIFNILSTTLNPVGTFVNNATLGSNGSGDERVFSSMREALRQPANADFLRPKSFLAVIILSDEDDFSDPNRPEYSYYSSTGIADHSYTNPGLEPVSTYRDFLDNLTASPANARRYAVNAITVMDAACRQQHAAQSSSTIIGKRYMELANMTNGALGSVCDSSFANSLADIQQRIIELQSQFYLGNQPVVSTIKIIVDGVLIPADVNNGWTYDPTNNSITFHGSGIPAPGASISVEFDPMTVTF
jgi:hypothetical protein